MVGNDSLQDFTEETTLTLRNDLTELDRVNAWTDAFCERHGLSVKMAYYLQLIFDELLTNIISYGYNDEAEHAIEVKLAFAGSAVEVSIVDDAMAFNPLEKEDPDIRQSVDERPIGGLGIYFVKRIVDEITYEREGPYNRLWMKRAIKPEDVQQGEN